MRLVRFAGCVISGRACLDHLSEHDRSSHGGTTVTY